MRRERRISGRSLRTSPGKCSYTHHPIRPPVPSSFIRPSKGGRISVRLDRVDSHAQLQVSDISMPGVDGYSLIRRIRATAGAGVRLPAIALTALGRAEDLARAMLAGFQIHVPKPSGMAPISRSRSIRARSRTVRMRSSCRQSQPEPRRPIVSGPR